MSLRDHLQTIYEERGQLTPALVVEVATPKTHPLHHRFEWDDQVAGHQYRVGQAADLIRSVKRRIANTSGEPARFVREFPSIPQEDRRSMLYEPLDVVAEDPIKMELIRREMEREWKILFERYGDFEYFRKMVRGALSA